MEIESQMKSPSSALDRYNIEVLASEETLASVYLENPGNRILLGNLTVEENRELDVDIIVSLFSQDEKVVEKCQVYQGRLNRIAERLFLKEKYKKSQFNLRIDIVENKQDNGYFPDLVNCMITTLLVSGLELRYIVTGSVCLLNKQNKIIKDEESCDKEGIVRVELCHRIGSEESVYFSSKGEIPKNTLPMVLDYLTQKCTALSHSLLNFLSKPSN